MTQGTPEKRDGDRSPQRRWSITGTELLTSVILAIICGFITAASEGAQWGVIVGVVLFDSLVASFNGMHERRR